MPLPVVTIVGTLVADPTLRFTQKGDAVASFTIAANSRKFDKESEKWVDGDATFLRASCWKKLAENVTERLTKGSHVIAIGTLKQDNWEQEGQKRTTLELQVEEIGESLRFVENHPKQAKADPWGAPVPTW